MTENITREWMVEVTGWNVENESYSDSTTVVAETREQAEVAALTEIRGRGMVEVGDVTTYALALLPGTTVGVRRPAS